MSDRPPVGVVDIRPVWRSKRGHLLLCFPKNRQRAAILVVGKLKADVLFSAAGGEQVKYAFRMAEKHTEN